MDSKFKKRKTAVRASKTSTTEPKRAPSPVPAGIISLRTLVLILLPLFSVVGAYGTLILGGANGFIATMQELEKQDAPFLPGTTDLLLRTYTEIAAIDKQLAVLVSFFAPLLDPQNRALVLFSIFGFGQLGAAWTLMMIEAMRRGNQGRIVSFVGTVGCIFQNISFTITVPLWLFLHVLTSPVAKTLTGSHARNVLFVSGIDLKILPLSVVLGYIIPSILMVLPSPSITSPLGHQRYIALWQPFPAWCVIIHMSLRYVFTTTSNKNTSADRQTAVGSSYLNSAKHVYRFIIAFCMVTYVPALLLTILPPSAFPSTPPYLQQFAQHSFAEVYIPYFPDLTYQVPSFAAAVHTFLQWDLYIGCGAMLLWGLFLLWNVTSERMAEDPSTSLKSYRELEGGKRSGMMWAMMRVGIWTALAGPMGVLAVLLWERDMVVKQKAKQGI